MLCYLQACCNGVVGEILIVTADDRLPLRPVLSFDSLRAEWSKRKDEKMIGESWMYRYFRKMGRT